MGKPTGFLEIPRESPGYRPVEERLKDWEEVSAVVPEGKVKDQAARCMDCGVPFCNQGCPLGNLIPEWNDYVYHNQWEEAIRALLKTNNFPEFTGRICPAPCEASCVLGINDKPVTIKLSEVSIIDHAWENGWIKPAPPKVRTGKKVAVVGSGPGGLAAADQLNKAGHNVTVFERAPRPGGLLTFGIPDFKLDKKKIVERRLGIMEKEGVVFKCNVNVGEDITIDQMKKDFDAIVFAMGSTQPRDLAVPGRELDGVHFAMDFLTPNNMEIYGDRPESLKHINAKGKRVVILGGGDTGADCLGTSHRHGAKSIHQFELMPKPPEERSSNNPWPQWPMIMRSSSAHEEGGERDWSIMTTHLSGENGKLTKLHGKRLEWKFDENGRMKMEEIPGSEFEMEADLIFLAMGFVHPEKAGPIEQSGVELDGRGNIKADENYATSVPGIFACGDCRRGQSLVVWAIAEGRKAAHAVDSHLMGYSDLPN